MLLLILFVASSFFLICQSSLTAQVPSINEQTNPTEDTPRFRSLVEADLDDAVTVFIEAFSRGAVWRYFHFNGDKYKDYTWNCIRKEVDRQWKHLPYNVFASVVSIPQHERHRGRSERVVAIGVWKMLEPGEDVALASSSNLLAIAKCSEYLDLNMTRVKDLVPKLVAAETGFIRGLNETQMYLSLLATHPDWDGNGFGARHCHWGMREAAARNVPATLFATPAGYPLYDSLGFESITNVTFDLLDDLGQVWFEKMMWRA